jgi:hypothetical protein
VTSAIKELQSGRTTKWRESRKYCLVYDGQVFSPKEVLGLAICCAEGVDPNMVKKFSGGSQTNDVLRKLGFEIVAK